LFAEQSDGLLTFRTSAELRLHGPGGSQLPGPLFAQMQRMGRKNRPITGYQNSDDARPALGTPLPGGVH
jgi:hypothetical protein